MKKILLTLILASFFISPEVLRAYDFSASGGVIAVSRPLYEGADENEIDFLPLIDITLGKSFFVNVEKGLGVYLMKNRVLEFGTSVGYYERRLERDSTKLTGLGDIDSGIDGRIFAKINIYDYSLSFQLQSDLSENHDGTLLIVGAGYSYGQHTDVNWNLTATMTFVNTNYMDTYFGVTSAQSSRSGITAYNTKGGLKDLAINSIISRDFDRHWSLKGVVGYKRLLGDADASPLVDGLGSEHQFQFGVGLAYKF